MRVSKPPIAGRAPNVFTVIHESWRDRFALMVVCLLPGEGRLHGRDAAIAGFRIAVGGFNRPDRGRRRVEYVTGYPPGTILITQSANTIPPDEMGNLSPRALVLSCDAL